MIALPTLFRPHEWNYIFNFRITESIAITVAITWTTYPRRPSPRELCWIRPKQFSKQCFSSLENDQFSFLLMINWIKSGAALRTRNHRESFVSIMACVVSTWTLPDTLLSWGKNNRWTWWNKSLKHSTTFASRLSHWRHGPRHASSSRTHGSKYINSFIPAFLEQITQFFNGNIPRHMHPASYRSKTYP
jgi:hypothetical protein